MIKLNNSVINIDDIINIGTDIFLFTITKLINITNIFFMFLKKYKNIKIKIYIIKA